MLLDAGIAVDARDHYQKTPLHWAAARSLEPVARLLLGAGADPLARDKSGWDPLRAAAHSGCYALVRELLDRGASASGDGGTPAADAPSPAAAAAEPTPASADVPTPLMCAAQKGHAHVCKLLLERRADPAARTPSSGLRALDYAEQGAHQGVVALLKPLTPIDRFEEGL